MKKIKLIVIAILAVIFAVLVISNELLLIIVMLTLPGVLLSLITLVPAVRRHARSNLNARIATLLAVVILSVVVTFFVTAWLYVQLFYVIAFIPRTLLEEYYDYPNEEFKEFEAKYEKKSSAIVHETWIRVMVPPFLRQQCYTTEKEVCEFVDQFPEVRRLLIQKYLQGVVIILAVVLVLSTPGGALTWYFTRRKYPRESIIKVSSEKERVEL